MKYLIVALVVVFGFWLWRKNRADASPDASAERPVRKPGQPEQPQLMFSCAACGLHLPRGEAVVGKQGSYCSAAHRAQKEG